MPSLLRALLVLAFLMASPPAAIQADAQAAMQASPAPSADDRKTELDSAWRDASKAAVRGPAEVPFRDQARLLLPAGMAFVPQAEATRLTRAMGNQAGPDFVGIVTSTAEADDWLVFVRWTADGYIRDDDARDLNADDILQNLRDGTEESNKDRVSRGFPELALQGWTQPPGYDPVTHRLSWSLRVVPKNDPTSGSINFNTRALGRYGYFSLNLIDSPDRIAQDRPVSAMLLSLLEYDEGKRYADFNVSTDHVAEYGLAALIGVVALKKLGLIALAGAFVLKFAKLGVLAVVGAGLALKRMFRKRPGA